MQLWVAVFSCLIVEVIVEQSHELGIIRRDKISQHDVIKMQLINEYIPQIQNKHNIVILASYKDVQLFQTSLYADCIMKFIATTSFIITSVSKEMLIRMREIGMQNNIIPIYMIIQPLDMTEQDITQLMGQIKQWQPAAKITVIYNEEVNVKEIFSNLNIYDIHAIRPLIRMEVTIYGLYEVCMFCDRGDDLVQLTNTWELQEGFKYPVTQENSFKGNFHGHKLAMGIGIYRYPNIYPKGRDQNGILTLSGTLYKTYMVLGGMLNITWTFDESFDRQRHLYYYSRKRRGYFAKGSLRDLLEDRVDVVGNGIAGNYKTYTFADFSSPEYYVPGHNIITVEPKKGIQWHGYITVWPWHIWMLIIVSIPTVGLVLYSLRICRDENAVFGDAIWDAGQIMLWDSIREPRPSCGMCLLLSSYMLVIFLVVNFYMGEYTAVLTTPKYEKPPVESLNQLWESDLKVMTPGYNTRYRRAFKHVKGIKDKLVKIGVRGRVDFRLAALIKLQKSPDEYAIIDSYNSIYSRLHKLSNFSRKFYRSKEELSNKYCTLFLPKSSTYKESIDVSLMTLHGMGIINYHTLEASPTLAIDKYNHKPGHTQLITFVHFACGLLILVVGYALAALAYIIEHSWLHLKQKTPKNREEDAPNKVEPEETKPLEADIRFNIATTGKLNPEKTEDKIKIGEIEKKDSGAHAKQGNID